jgi:flavorubredoxin
MKALVVVESVFGNTQRIAEAIAQGLSMRMDVRTVDVGDAPTTVDTDVDLLVVGGPTHAFGLTRASTRKSAAEQSEGSAVAAEVGLREWLDALSNGQVAAATFDTRMDHPRLPGSAAAAARKQLKRLGYHMAGRPESFRVSGTSGPLLDGEVDRARVWGDALAAQFTGAGPARSDSAAG